MPTFRELSTGLKAFDQKLMNVSFWQDTNAIKTYCNSILKYYGRKTNVHIDLGRYADKACARKNNQEDYTICLPTMPMVFTDEADKVKQVYMRGILLKHEISHILFTDYEWQFATDDRDFHVLVNIIDDIRIEKLFGRKLRGSVSGFNDLRDIFHENYATDVENKPIALGQFHRYMQSTLRGQSFKNTTQIKFYEGIFKQFEGIDTFDIDAFKRAMEELHQVIKSTKEFNNPAPKEQDEQESGQDQKEQEDQDGEESEDGQEQDGEESEDGQESKDGQEQDGEESENGQKSEDSQESKDGQEQKCEESEDGQEQSDKQDGEENKSSDSKGEGSNDSDSKSAEESEADGDEEKAQSDARDALGKDADDIKSMDDLSDKLFREREAKVTLKDLKEQYEFDENAFTGAVELDIIRLSEIYNGFPGFNSKMLDGQRRYKAVTHYYRGVISECVRFLKLKMQHRTFNRELNFRLEGKLDQKNLKEIIINHEDPRAFATSIIRIEPKSRMHILIDISVSMRDTQLQICFTNAIIMAEICRRLCIDFGVYMFSSSTPELKVKEAKCIGLSRAAILRSLPAVDASMIDVYGPLGYSGYSHVNLSSDLSVPHSIQTVRITNDGRGVVTTVKHINEQFTPRLQSALGKLSEMNNISKIKRKLSSGTPEFESVNQIFKNNAKTKKNILFIINDGCFCSFLPGRSIDTNGSNDGYSDSVRMSLSPRGMNTVETCRNICVAELNQYITQQNNGFVEVYDNPENFEEFVNIVFEKLRANRNYNQVDRMTAKHIALKLRKVRMQSFEVAREAFVKTTPADDIQTWRSALVGNIGASLTAKNIADGAEFVRSEEFAYGCTFTIHSGMFLDDEALKIAQRELVAILKGSGSPDTIVYKAMIEKMRANGWRVYGIGIQSAQGKLYIGSKNFMEIASENEIITSFARKLREIF